MYVFRTVINTAENRSAIALDAVQRRSALGRIILGSSFESTPFDIFHWPTHFPRRVRCQYRSRSSLVESYSPSECSNGVRPMRISKNLTPSDQTRMSDLRVSWGRSRARSGERYR